MFASRVIVRLALLLPVGILLAACVGPSTYHSAVTGEALDAAAMAARFEKNIRDSDLAPLLPPPTFVSFAPPRMEFGMKPSDVVVQVLVDGDTGRIIDARVRRSTDAYTGERVLAYVRKWVYTPFDSGKQPNHVVFEHPFTLRWAK